MFCGRSLTGATDLEVLEAKTSDISYDDLKDKTTVSGTFEAVTVISGALTLPSATIADGVYNLTAASNVLSLTVDGGGGGGVTSIQGSGQIAVNGNFVDAQTGVISLALPQSIGTGDSVEFKNLGLNGGLNCMNFSSSNAEINMIGTTGNKIQMVLDGASSETLSIRRVATTPTIQLSAAAPQSLVIDNKSTGSVITQTGSVDRFRVGTLGWTCPVQPLLRVSRLAQAIPNNVVTAISFNVSDSNNAATIYTTALPASNIVIGSPGVYAVNAFISFPLSLVGVRILRINTVNQIPSLCNIITAPGVNVTNSAVTCSAIVVVATTETITIQTLQNSALTQNVDCYLRIFKLS